MRAVLVLILAFLPMPLIAHEAAMVRHAVIDGVAGTEVRGDGVDAATRFPVASVGKIFTACAVLRLVEEGRLDLDTPAARHLGGGIVDGFGGMRRVTIRHLLTMTSGLPDYYTDDYLSDALDDRDGVQRPEVALRYAMGDAPLFAPGEGFDYSNTNYVMLGLILEAATGQPYARVLADRVFRPAGMTDSFVFGSRPLPDDVVTGHAGRTQVRAYYEGQGFGDGGVISSARDLARFYTALFAGRVLSADMLDVLLTDPIGQGYGMGVEVEAGIVGHSGGDYGFAADVRMDPASGDVAIVLVAREDGDTDWAWDRLAAR